MRYIYILGALFVGLSSFAQTKTSNVILVDSANKKLKSAPLDAFTIAGNALAKSKKEGDRRGEAEANKTLGTLYYNNSEYSKAIPYFLQAEQLFETLKDTKNRQYVLDYLGKCYEALGELDKSIGYYTKAEELADSDSSRFEFAYSNSRVQNKAGDKELARKSLEYELDNNASLDPRQKANAYLELGESYIQEDSIKGIDFIKKAVSETKDKADDSTQLLTLSNASKIFTYNGFKAQNRDLLNSALEESSPPSYSSLSHYNLGMDYLEINPQLATYHFEQSAALVEDQPETPEYIRAVEKLSEAYAKDGKYKEALSSYKKYVELVDSMKIADLKAELKKEVLSAQFEVQEARIKDLEDAQIAGALELKRQQRTILGLAAGLSLFLVLTYFLVKNIRDKQRSNLQIQLASLRSKMNPHFIFNSLNSVNEYISLNDEVKANHYLSDFSKLMRTVLDNSNHSTISLSEEIQSLEIYLKLEHARFEDQFDYEITVEEGLELQALEIPPMLIQPYIENAIWHGLRYKEDKGKLNLSFSKNNNKLRVEIVDDGIGRARSKEMKTRHQKDYQSMGIKTTEERIRLLNELNKTSVEVKIEDAFSGAEDVGTRVVLKLPLNYSE